MGRHWTRKDASICLAIGARHRVAGSEPDRLWHSLPAHCCLAEQGVHFKQSFADQRLPCYLSWPSCGVLALFMTGACRRGIPASKSPILVIRDPNPQTQTPSPKPKAPNLAACHADDDPGWCSSLNAFSRGLGPPIAGALMHLGCSLERGGLRLGRYLPFYVNLIPASAPQL